MHVNRSSSGLPHPCQALRRAGGADRASASNIFNLVSLRGPRSFETLPIGDASEGSALQQALSAEQPDPENPSPDLSEILEANPPPPADELLGDPLPQIQRALEDLLKQARTSELPVERLVGRLKEKKFTAGDGSKVTLRSAVTDPSFSRQIRLLSDAWLFVQLGTRINEQGRSGRVRTESAPDLGRIEELLRVGELVRLGALNPDALR
ncbi:MAG: hypothetical protein ACREKI_06935, partial [Gemmatimonadota bacterium]